jgi:hypothetical protein
LSGCTVSGNFDGSEAAASFAFAAFGIKVEITVNDSALLDRLPAYLPYGLAPAPGLDLDRRYSLLVLPDEARHQAYELHRDAIPLLRSDDLDEVLESLERDLRWLLADEARDWIFIHAGAVEWRGRAIVLPGASGAGKSSLIAELVRAGALYYSDEYAILDLQGRVHPFATPLQLRPEGQTRQTRRFVEELGGHAGREPVPVGLIASVVFRAGAPGELLQISPASGVLRLLENIAARSRPDQVLEVLSRVVSQAPTFAGERDEASVFARRLLGLLDARIDD